jgi:hypothetical protein
MVIVFEVIGTHFRRTNDDSAARMLAYFESTGRSLFGFDAENRIPKHLVRPQTA